VAELEVYCLKRDQEKIFYQIQGLTKEDHFFEPTYLTPNYPRKETQHSYNNVESNVAKQMLAVHLQVVWVAET
jgi:hypothetical protein